MYIYTIYITIYKHIYKFYIRIKFILTECILFINENLFFNHKIELTILYLITRRQTCYSHIRPLQTKQLREILGHVTIQRGSNNAIFKKAQQNLIYIRQR